MFDSPFPPASPDDCSLGLPPLEDASETELQEADPASHAIDADAWTALHPEVANLPSHFSLASNEPPVTKKASVEANATDARLSAYQHPQGGTLKGAMEAVLFMTNKPMHINELAERLNVSYSDAEDALLDLVQDYAFRTDSSLEIGDSEEGYILQVREEYGYLTQQMIPMNLSTATVRTLSVIAIRGPLLQSTLIDLRGSTAYDHVQELLKHGLVHKKRQGRSSLLSVTARFHEQFKLNGKPDDLELLVELELKKPLIEATTPVDVDESYR